MASALTYSRRYHVFPSFHGPDVRRTFLSHLQKHFVSKGIMTFKDQEMERGHTIGPELVQAIRESRVSMVVLSKNYASSSWCLDELVEILKCKRDRDQIVMTVFYDVDPSHVRKQLGDFGIAFEKTCQGKTDQVKLRWSQALTNVADIAGEHNLKWDDEGKMIEKIAIDVSEKLNLTLSRDFEGMVGMEAHLRKVHSYLNLECDDVKMIGIWGPAGIGKTTIARVLFNQLSTSFPLSCFMGNIKRSYNKSILGVDDYESKLCLQSQLLSNILNQKNIRVRHLGAVKEWLQDQRVLIVLDDVDDLEQLETLSNETSWFGLRSRIIVTTEDKKILRAHSIDDIYSVDFPSEEEALEIFLQSAFKKKSPLDGFEELAKKVAKLCGNLPLGLSVVSSSLRGETKAEWELQLFGLETSLDRKTEDILRVGYDKLSKIHQSIFLHIACFFNNEDVDHVTTMLAQSNMDVRNGMKILADKSLVHISSDGKIVMHYLLQKLGRQEVVRQSNEPGKRQFLVETQDVLNVLANGTGTESVVGISLDLSNTEELFISRRAFEGMRNLQFLRVFMGHSNANVGLCTLEGMEFLPRLEDMVFLPRLRLLHWNSYPGKSLPPTFRPEFLIELRMPSSKFEKLWEGIQRLVNLKKVDLNFCFNLKEIPNLSRATNLETLTLIQCTSLMKFPSSIVNLHKLTTVRMWGCKRLQVVPTNTDSTFSKKYSPRMRSFPDITRNINNLWVGGPSIVASRKMLDEGGRDFKRLPHIPESVWKLEDINSCCIERIPAYVRPQTLTSSQNCTIGCPSAVRRWTYPQRLDLGCRKLQRLTHVPKNFRKLDLSGSGIESIPYNVTGLHQLQTLIVENCTKLMSVKDLPSSLKSLHANNCVSLERVEFSMFLQDSDSIRELMFRNCLSLDKEARRVIMNRRFAKYICLPGKEVPPEFTYKAAGHSLTISLGTFSTASSRFKACFLLSPIKDNVIFHVNCYIRSKEGVIMNQINYLVLTSDQSPQSPHVRTQHLFILRGDLSRNQNRVNTGEILFEFTCSDDHKITECGVRILNEKDDEDKDSGYCESEAVDNQTDEAEAEAEAVNVKRTEEDTGCWRFLWDLITVKASCVPQISM